VILKLKIAKEEGWAYSIFYRLFDCLIIAISQVCSGH